MDLKRLCCCRTKKYDVPIRYGDIFLGRDGSVAVPYKDSKKTSIATASSISDDGDSGHQEVPEQDGRRITTRARFTYGLERFEKNAMLILGQTEPQGRQFVDQRVEMLTHSFGGFGFEVEAHVDLDPEQMEAQLEEFFRRDFSGVGAVCVVAVGGAGEAGQLQARAVYCHESRVLRHLTNELPSALTGRPRIYITEMARSGAATDSGAYSLPITVLFPDVIAVHIPVIIEGESNPLQMLCDRLGSERDFRAEVTAAAHAAESALPALAARPIQVDSTLSLELELVRTESMLDGGNATSENVPYGVKGSSENLPNGANETSAPVN